MAIITTDFGIADAFVDDLGVFRIAFRAVGPGRWAVKFNTVVMVVLCFDHRLFAIWAQHDLTLLIISTDFMSALLLCLL